MHVRPQKRLLRLGPAVAASVCLLAAGLLAGPSWSAERERSLLESARAVPLTNTKFYEAHLMPRVSRQIGKVAAVDLGPDQPLGENVLFDQMAADAQGAFEKAGTRALEYYMRDETALGRMLGDLESRHSGIGRIRTQSASFGFDISGGRPQLQLKSLRAFGRLDLSLGFDGLVRLRLNRGSQQEMFLRADPTRNSYSVECRVGF